MKRCPECRRDYYDDSLSYCLEDGAVLLSGLPDEPATATWGQPFVIDKTWIDAQERARRSGARVDLL